MIVSENRYGPKNKSIEEGMSIHQGLVPIETIQNRILVIRGEKVMIDADLAQLYGVTTKRLNEQVKRNRERFPDDFMFQLTTEEKAKVVANCDHLRPLKYSSNLPYAFTEHGAIMLAAVLNSPIAIEASLYVVRAFVQLRKLLRTHKELGFKLNELERKISLHDSDIHAIVAAIRELMAPPEQPKKEIGFRVKETKAQYKTKR
jgi:hypothetical protein